MRDAGDPGTADLAFGVRRALAVVARALLCARGRSKLAWMMLIVVLGGGCSLFRDTVNASPGLRWWLFSNFGANQLCPEMLRRGVPLRLTQGSNVIGRFFPNRCQHVVNDPAQTVTLHFGGNGYGWTPVAGRIGFVASAAVELRPDFFLAEDAMYVWGRIQRVVQGPELRIDGSENALVDWATKGPLGQIASSFAGQIMSSQLTSGFTVVRTDEGDEFSLGILQPPARPKRPFDVSGDERYVFANETAEIRAEQVDFLGPVLVPKAGQAIFFRHRSQGPAAEALVYDRRVADYFRDGLQRGTPLGPPAQPPIASFVLGVGESEQKLRVPPGEYMIVVDHSSRVGRVNPPWNPLATVGGGTLVLSYRLELGEAD